MPPLAPSWSLWLMAGFAFGSLLAFTLALVVYRSRPHRLQNRALALLLMLESLSSAASAAHLAFNTTDLSWAGLYTFFLFWLWTLAVYPVFLGTLQTPLARAFRHPIVLGIIWLVCGAWTVLMFTRPDLFLVGPLLIDGNIEFAYGPAAHAFTFVSLPVVLYAMVVAISAWRRAPPGSPRRKQAKAYAVAFIVRDILLVVSVINFLVLPWFIATGLFGSVEALVFGRTVYVAQIILFPLIAGYGILRHQLFGIDLKIKWAIHKSTLLAVFVGVFFVSAQIAQAFLTTEYGWAVGGLVAGLLLLAINPLQRITARVADTAMPNVQDTEEYRTVRKGEVYQAALEEILSDGRITAKERRTLIRLQEQLGLDASTAQTIEVDILDAREVA